MNVLLDQLLTDWNYYSKTEISSELRYAYFEYNCLMTRIFLK